MPFFELNKQPFKARLLVGSAKPSFHMDPQDVPDLSGMDKPLTCPLPACRKGAFRKDIPRRCRNATLILP